MSSHGGPVCGYDLTPTGGQYGNDLLLVRPADERLDQADPSVYH